MKIKRVPLLGVIKSILTIILITTIIMCTVGCTMNNKVAEPTKTSSFEKSTQPPKDKEVQLSKNKETQVEEKTKIPQKEIMNTVPRTEIPSSQIVEKPTEETTSQPMDTLTTYIYNITPTDRETLVRLVYLEGNIESIECQKAIASVVINRLNSGYWGNTINGVIYAPNQFAPASRIARATPTATNYEAVDYVLTNGVTLPSYVLYFRAGYHFSWNGYVPYTSMGNTYFGYMSKDKK
jgi:spore germination cell wall hydrolase CwlJ-like protein